MAQVAGRKEVRPFLGRRGLGGRVAESTRYGKLRGTLDGLKTEQFDTSTRTVGDHVRNKIREASKQIQYGANQYIDGDCSFRVFEQGTFR